MFYGNKFRECIDSKRKWREIHRMGLVNRDNARVKVNEVNNQFSNSPMPHININFYDNVILSRQQSDEFNLINFTQEEVLESFLNVKSNAVGYDGMHPKFVKITLTYTLTYFTHLFNTIVTTSTFPSMWKHAKIVPILKPDKSFRPIAILSIYQRFLRN